MNLNTAKTVNEINKTVFDILYREIGVSQTYRFLNQFFVGKGNYVEMKDELFRNRTVDDIVAEMKSRK